MLQRRSIWILVFGLGLLEGCVVPQPRGQGKYALLQEPTTKAWYHLYLPVDYVWNDGRHPDARQDKWPLVMSFHGMKPYDSASAQEREWEQEADQYGYIVCAPKLQTSDSFMEYPLTKEHDYVLRDRENVMAIMDQVFLTTRADPQRVLSTSWSCGGYLAHYFANRYPERFSCIATRLSNFSSKLMVEETVPQYRDRVPVAIFIGDGDFPACKGESQEAVAWYTARKFRVRGKMIDHMGHSRIPQTAAAFFAEQLGIGPLHSVEAAKTVGRVQMTDYYAPADMIARYSPPPEYGG
jgi:dienelactone hydrolase